LQSSNPRLRIEIISAEFRPIKAGSHQKLKLIVWSISQIESERFITGQTVFLVVWGKKSLWETKLQRQSDMGSTEVATHSTVTTRTSEAIAELSQVGLPTELLLINRCGDLAIGDREPALQRCENFSLRLIPAPSGSS